MYCYLSCTCLNSEDSHKVITGFLSKDVFGMYYTELLAVIDGFNFCLD